MYKAKIIKLFLCVICCGIFIVSINFTLDPFQIYHKNWFDNYFSGEQRYQNAGLINNYFSQDGYDSIVIGNSLSQCFSTIYIDNKLNWKTLKLSMSGASLFEQYNVLNYALKHGKVKNVIWMIGSSYSNDRNTSYLNPFYLYDDNHFNDLRYLSSMSPIIFYINKLKKKKDLEHSNYWCDDKGELDKFTEFNKPDNLLKLAKNIKTTISKFDMLETINNEPFDEYIKPIIEENPDVNFYIVYPPRSLLSKLSGGEALYLRKFLTLKLLKYKNVKVYGFDNVKAITSDMNNYKDEFGHYRPWVNDYMIDAIANDMHRLTKDNIDSYMKEVIEQIKNYKICSNGKCYD